MKMTKPNEIKGKNNLPGALPILYAPQRTAKHAPRTPKIGIRPINGPFTWESPNPIQGKPVRILPRSHSNNVQDAAQAIPE